jgi:hypothetical protein
VKARWAGETYFTYQKSSVTGEWFRTVGAAMGREWLPAPGLSELQAVVSYAELVFYHTYSKGAISFPVFSVWLDSALRDCEKLAEVWEWEKGKP